MTCPAIASLDDWDMRSDRNKPGCAVRLGVSLDDWDMRSDRNLYDLINELGY